MASPPHPTTMESLPGDVLSNIFTRLLARQLAQMRCVSKPWNALLSQPPFIKFHLHRAIHNNPEILLVFYEKFSFYSGPFTAHSTQFPNRVLTKFIERFFKLPVNPKSRYSSGDVIGSVNGLICFKYLKKRSDYVVYIWNPSLSVVLTLPPFSMPPYGNDPFEMLFRFGYDPKTDDYKVVKVTCLLQPPSLKPDRNTGVQAWFGTDLYVAKEWLQVEIYSMRKGYWELICQRVPSHVTRIFDRDELCVDGHDGHLHWLGYVDHEERKVETIVAFDLNVETFCEISLPNSIQDDNILYRRTNVLGVLAGKLCVMSRVSLMMGCGTVECEVWVMDQYGVVESWVKQHVFSQLGHNCIIPFGFTLHNEFLFEGFAECDGSDDDTVLLLYDPVADKAKTFNILARHNITDNKTKVVEYVDSLVWVAPTDREVNSCSVSRLKI